MNHRRSDQTFKMINLFQKKDKNKGKFYEKCVIDVYYKQHIANSDPPLTQTIKKSLSLSTTQVRKKTAKKDMSSPISRLT